VGESEIHVAAADASEEESKSVLKVSESTMKIIEELKKDKQLTPSVVPLKINLKKDLLSEENSMRAKHGQLISVRRELVLPAHYKKIIEIAKSLDTSLHFIKQCRSGGSGT
jgi:hypothetical protein